MRSTALRFDPLNQVHLEQESNGQLLQLEVRHHFYNNNGPLFVCAQYHRTHS